MFNWVRHSPSRILSFALLGIALAGCTRKLDSCQGPIIDLSRVDTVKKSVYSTAARAFLVNPNPIDATKNNNAQAGDAAVVALKASFALPDLTSSNRLENIFVKVRQKEITDDASLLASPDSSGNYNFDLTDPHYAETMAYASIMSVSKYVESLGFSYVKSRPLYVMAHTLAASGDANAVNAFYLHNTMFPDQPRVMKMVGATNFAPGVDRDMYWHEMGHFANESVSRERGIDRAGEMGAIYTEASSLHECTADFIAESLGNKAFIGKWINRNFQNTPGVPLRSAVDYSGSQMDFKKVIANDGTGMSPERYQVAEWCTRVLWQIRQQFVTEDSTGGSVFADRMVLAAVSQLPQDASITDFYRALKNADSQLHCGIHSKSIDQAFESKGFDPTPDRLGNKLQLQVMTSSQASSSSAAVKQVFFGAKITNSNSVTARNVRLVVETSDNRSSLIIPMQGYGDLPPGKSITISASTGLALDFAPEVDVDTTRGTGTLRYRLRLISENGEEVSVNGEVTP